MTDISPCKVFSREYILIFNVQMIIIAIRASDAANKTILHKTMRQLINKILVFSVLGFKMVLAGLSHIMRNTVIE